MSFEAAYDIMMWHHAFRYCISLQNAVIPETVQFIDSKGVMQTGWFALKNKKYYFDTDGAMVTGTKVIDGVTYVFAETGELISSEQ